MTGLIKPLLLLAVLLPCSARADWDPTAVNAFGSTVVAKTTVTSSNTSTGNTVLTGCQGAVPVTATGE